MENRSLLGVAATVLIACAIFWGVYKSVDSSSADTELQQMLAASKQVKTFRGAYVASMPGTYESERTWEVDCNRVIVHQQSKASQTSSDSPFNLNQDEILLGSQMFTRDSSGAWKNDGEVRPRGQAKRYCDSIAIGDEKDLLPDLQELTRHGIMEKGDKKVVNGAKCRDWKFDMRTAMSSRKGSICIGVDDHLPYEFVMDSGHYTYSDYNQPLQIDAPDASLQPVSSTAPDSSDGSN